MATWFHVSDDPVTEWVNLDNAHAIYFMGDDGFTVVMPPDDVRQYRNPAPAARLRDFLKAHDAANARTAEAWVIPSEAWLKEKAIDLDDDPAPRPARQCSRCRGCGQIANSDEGEAWVDWEELPLESKIAVSLGMVRPIPCPSCGGSGRK